MANNPVISKIKLANGTVVDLKDAAARSDLATLLGSKSVAALGTAAFLDSVSTVADGGTNLPTAGAVYTAIQNAVAGLVGAMHFIGKVEGDTLAAAITAYKTAHTSYSEASGDIVIWGVKEYVYDGTTWQELGDESIYLTTATAASTYVAKTRTICGIDLADDVTAAEMKTALGLGALAYKASASGTVESQTITGVKATGTSTGSIAVVLDQTDTSATLTKAAYTPAGTITGSAISGGSINVTVKDAASATEATLTRGDYTPAGSVSIAADNNGAFQVAGTNAASAVTFTGTGTESVLGSVKDAAVLPSFTDNKIGTFVAPELQTGFYSAGTAPSYTQGTKASLTDQTKSAFATQGIVAAIGTDHTKDATPGEDESETLIFSAASTSNAVTDRGTFTANGDDTWSAGTMASVDVSKFYAGSWTAGTFNAGSAATFNTATVIDDLGTAEAAAQVFTGNKYAPSFTGTKEENLKVTKAEYLKQEIDTKTFTPVDATLGFSGTEVANFQVTGVTYSKATVNATDTKFTGADISLDVGDIAVASKSVTVE